ncbi:hypothetical protein MRB53_010525 [Persea americana]|uniref:Uncharacterized protein n=1 Tax=Persea americana TaxID=3435 RepID=A0ACC2LSU1_PERAE|nr:hypothetical protein MRB53_010525 [Persea americana]
MKIHPGSPCLPQPSLHKPPNQQSPPLTSKPISLSLSLSFSVSVCERERETLKTYLIQKKIEEKKVTTMYGFSTKFSNSIMRTGIFGGDRIFAAGFVTMDSNLAGLRFFIAMANAKFWP